MRVAVIGAGPSGLVTLKYLKTAHQFFPIKPIEALLFEAEAAVGGTFAHRTYEDAEVCCFCFESQARMLTWSVNSSSRPNSSLPFRTSARARMTQTSSRLRGMLSI